MGPLHPKRRRRRRTLYLHVFNWPRDGKLLVPGLKSLPNKAFLLEQPSTALAISPTETGMAISVPATAPDSVSTTVVLQIKGALQIDEPPVPPLSQQPDGSIQLRAVDAQLHGDQLRYESGAARDCIGWWFNPSEWAQWDVLVTKPGAFDVSAEIAATEPGSLELTIGDQKVSGAAPVTGDYGQFKSVKLGTLRIDTPGKTEIGLRAVREGWHALNVRTVRLDPAPAP